MRVHQLDRAQARRIAIRAQLLDEPRPVNLVETIRHLTMLQIDPIAAVAPSADLVAWSRLGSAYRPEDLRKGLDVDRTLWEHRAVIRPMDDLGICIAKMRREAAHPEIQQWVLANERFAKDLIERLRADGPMPSRDLPDTAKVPWKSTGWTNNRNVTRMLEFLMMRGEVAVSGRRGKQRLWDLAVRVFPSIINYQPLDEAAKLLNERRLRSLGIVLEKYTGSPGEPIDMRGIGEPAVIDGVPGRWRVHPQALGDTFEGRTALLSPFDRLVHDRARLAAIFEFEYLLEMYKPAAQRRWGYFALPVLHHDRLVGKADITADRKNGVLRVNALHEDIRFTADIHSGVRRELADLAAWLHLELDVPKRVPRSGTRFASVTSGRGAPARSAGTTAT